MTQGGRFEEIIAIYQRHGWQLQRVLLRPKTRVALRTAPKKLFGEARLREADFDGLWFARPSPRRREAWELRLVADQPYALFQAFALRQTEAEREVMLHEMEERMREYVARRESVPRA